MFELIDFSPYGLYFLLVAGIIILPGMDMAFVMASTLVGGRPSGAAAVGGIVLGGMIHVLMSGLGIGLLLLAAPGLFNLMLLAGSLYVAWMGWSLLRGASALGEVRDESARPLRATFVRAVATCLLNPKAYIFMLAVFPQFLRPEQGSMALQCVLLGAITAVTQVLVYGAVVQGAAVLKIWLRGHGPAQVGLGRAVGALLMLMAVWTALQGWQRLG